MSYTSKRKRDEFDDEEEEPSPGRQILPVANLPEDFDGIPEDGLQYLFTVRRDARHLPRTTRVANPYEFIDPLPTPPEETPLTTAHHPLPYNEWRTSFEEHFRNFRKNIVQQTTAVHQPFDPNRKLMPEKRERDLWWAFIAGRPESDWNPPKKPKQTSNPKGRGRFGKMRGFTDDQDDHTSNDYVLSQETWHINEEGEVELSPSEDTADPLPTLEASLYSDVSMDDLKSTADAPLEAREPQDVFAVKLREPTPSLMRHIDPRTSLHLLMYFAHWIDLHLEQPDPPSSYLTETHARWIFVLLSRVEDRVTADDMSLLRSVARSCLALLKRLLQKQKFSGDEQSVTHVGVADLVQDRMGERSCWMIISLVVGIWGQQDLWIEAKNMLAGLES